MTVLTTGIALGSLSPAFAQDRQQPNPSLDFQLPFEAKQSQVFSFKRDTFQPYVGGVFKVRAGAKSVNMTLESVRDCTPSAKSSKLAKKVRPSDCFALVFRAPGKLTELTTIYDVEHGALGTFALFMTRRDGPGNTYFYEAVINHAL